MTLALNAEVFFETNESRAAILLRQVTEITTESSWKQLTERATLTLPRKLKYFDSNKVRDVFRRGDAVRIKFGYNGDLNEEFTGYITEVSAAIPITIKMEDEMWKLKQLPVNFSSPNISLESLLSEICPGYSIDALEGVQLGGVRFSQTSVAKVLEKLQTEWGLYSYMKGKQLVCGKYYADDSEAETLRFHLERNCVSNSLNYRMKEDVLISITAISTLPNGQKIEVTGIGDKNGQERRLTFYNIEVKAELERLAKLEYKKYKQDGFDGEFTAFGIPVVRHGLKTELTSQLYGDRNGTYYVEGVNKTFGKGGIRQDVQLGDKATD